MIPLFHDFEGERVLVFGGGTVGARKARRFDREATVYVVAPEFGNRDFGDANQLAGEPGPGAVESWIERVDPALVVAATDDVAVNAAVESVAMDRGLLVNRADRGGSREPGSVVVPATARDDPIVVAIATGGNAPVLSGYLREFVEGAIDGLGALAELLADLRDELDEYGVPTRHRRQALRDVVESEAVREALAAEDQETAREAAIALLETYGSE